MGCKGGAYAVVLDVIEAELREEGPKATPAAGKNAGLSGLGGVLDQDKDAYEQVVW
jgi:hypothetical protein